MFFLLWLSQKSLKTTNLALCPHFVDDKIEPTDLTTQNSLSDRIRGPSDSLQGQSFFKKQNNTHTHKKL